MTSKLQPQDPRATHHTAVVRGKTYHYRLARPGGGAPVRGTILLVHGFPDLGFGWRYQVPVLAEALGLRVVVPDMLGYGQTDAPADVAPYAFRSVCADLVALVDHVLGESGGEAGERFFVGGHDWGGAVAWRMALWHGARLRGVFSVCTPYFAPSSSQDGYASLAEVAQRLPNFAYQQQFAGDALWQAVAGDAGRLRAFLQALYGGRPSDGDTARPLFDTARGVDLDRICAGAGAVRPSPLLSADEMDYYVAEYARHGLRGPTNWYRTGRLNWADERALVAGGGQGGGGAPPTIAVPSLMLSATADAALPPALADQMGKHFARLVRDTVPGSHWVLWQSSAAVNDKITAFLRPLLDGPPKAAL